MTHLFLLYVLVNGQIQSADMWFYDINRCNYFANAIVAADGTWSLVEGWVDPRIEDAA
jgi:hypothetical protein